MITFRIDEEAPGLLTVSFPEDPADNDLIRQITGRRFVFVTLLSFSLGMKSRQARVEHKDGNYSFRIFLNVNITMLSTKDYSTMTLDELASKEKKLKSQRIITALIVGFLVGVAIWSASHKGGFFLTIGLLIFSLIIGSSYSKSLKGVQEEISRRDTVR